MKAMVMTGTGGPEVLELRDVACPEPAGQRDLLVRLKAAGVNPVDTKLRSKGVYVTGEGPDILGCDGAGVVEAVGAGVQRFAVGDELYFCNGGIGGPVGNYAEFAVIDERFAARKPANLSFAEAGAAPLVLLTAWESLQDRGRVQAGHKVLVHAGAGGVGHVAIQLAVQAGAKVCATVGSADKAEFVRSLGAERVVRYRDEDWVRSVLDWTDNEGVDLALDTVGDAAFAQTFAVVRHYGSVVTLLQPGADTDWKTARLRNLSIFLELMLSPMFFGLEQWQVHQADILAQCAELFEAGRLRVEVAGSYPLEKAAEAHRRLEGGSMTGKLVLVME